MANSENLKPFLKGYDPRRGSKPKGSKHISTLIRELLEDENFEYKLPNGVVAVGPPISAVLKVIILKAIGGDLKAFDLLAKYGYGSKLELSLHKTLTPAITPLQAEQLLLIRARGNNRGQ